MGSGLIWAGIGKGIADAGATYGNMMFRAAESELADQRAMQRAEALERLKESMLEERAQKDATKAVEVEGRALKIGEERQGKAFDKLAASSAEAGEQGDIPLSKEQLQAFVKDNPEIGKQYRGMGLIDAQLPMSRNEQRLQSADDQVQAARELGASSTLLKSYQDTKKSVLDAIKEENRTEEQRRRDQQNSDRQAASDRRFEATLKIQQQNADANTTRANKPSGKSSDSGDKPITGVDLERSAKAAEKALALELGVPVKDLQSEVARLKKRNALSADAQAKLDSYNTALTSWQNYKSKPSDNAKPAATISALPKGAVQIGTSGGKPVYQTPDGKKFIGK